MTRHTLSHLLRSPDLAKPYARKLREEICATDRHSVMISGHVDYLNDRADYVDVLLMIDDPAILAKGMQILINQYAPEEQERSIPTYSLQALYGNLKTRLTACEATFSPLDYVTTAERCRTISRTLDAAYEMADARMTKESGWRRRVLLPSEGGPRQASPERGSWN